MGKHGYWKCKLPTTGQTKRWENADYADTITDKLTEAQVLTVIERYNARADAFNQALRDHTGEHPTVNGASFSCGTGRQISLHHGTAGDYWVLDILFVPRFQFWPGRDVIHIKRADIKRLDLHWANGAHDKFYEWLAAA